MNTFGASACRLTPSRRKFRPCQSRTNRYRMQEPLTFQSLSGVAIFLLAVNLAYLRFEIFEHRERIRKHALGKLGSVEEIPDSLKELEFYKRLSYWAGISEDGEEAAKLLGWRGNWYPWLFDSKRDRVVPELMVWLALPVVIAGIIAVSGLVQLEIHAIWFKWVVALGLVLMTVGSVVLVLSGNGYITRACRSIDKDAEQWGIVMKNEAKRVRTKPVGHARLPSSMTPPTTRLRGLGGADSSGE